MLLTIIFGWLLVINNNVLICWGQNNTGSQNSKVTTTLPSSYTNTSTYKTMATIIGVNPTPTMAFCIYQESMSTFRFTQTLSGATGFMFLCVGY